jgi:hypothetical protein
MGIGTLKTIASSFYTLVPESFWTHAHHEARRTEEPVGHAKMQKPAGEAGFCANGAQGRQVTAYTHGK